MPVLVKNAPIIFQGMINDKLSKVFLAIIALEIIAQLIDIEIKGPLPFISIGMNGL